MIRIVFAGGGTLGHIYPMMPVIERLKQLYPDIYIIFIGSKTGLEKKLLKDSPYIDEHHFLDVQGFKRKLSFKNFTTIHKYFKSLKFCQRLFTEKTPDVVIGMGGYVSAPVVKSACKLKIKTIIHEQNSVMGLANKLLLKRVDTILLSYDIALNNKKTILIGNPRSSQVYEQTPKLVKKENLIPQVLVVGGSRGASQINEAVLNLGFELKNKKIKIILVTGERYYQNNIKKITALKNEYLEVLAFSNDLIGLMSQSDLVISRSGATTIAELMALKKITLFIPSPNVTNNHQYKNAKVLADHSAARILTEDKLNTYTLMNEIEELLYNTKLRQQMSKNIEKFQYLDATEEFVGTIINLLSKS